MRYKNLLTILSVLAICSWLWSPPSPEVLAAEPVSPTDPRVVCRITPGESFATTIFDVTLENAGEETLNATSNYSAKIEQDGKVREFFVEVNKHVGKNHVRFSGSEIASNEPLEELYDFSRPVRINVSIFVPEPTSRFSRGVSYKLIPGTPVQLALK